MVQPLGIASNYKMSPSFRSKAENSSLAPQSDLLMIKRLSR